MKIAFSANQVTKLTGATPTQLHNWFARKWIVGDYGSSKGHVRVYTIADVIIAAIAVDLSAVHLVKKAEEHRGLARHLEWTLINRGWYAASKVVEGPIITRCGARVKVELSTCRVISLLRTLGGSNGEYVAA